MLLRADEGHVWCWERESPSRPCLAHPAPAPRFPCGAITFTRRRRTALRFQAPEPSAPAKGEQGRKPAATRGHTARSAPLVRTRPPTRGLAPLHLHILVSVTLRSHSRLLVRYSFSSGGHESSNALAVLLSRCVRSLVVLFLNLLTSEPDCSLVPPPRPSLSRALASMVDLSSMGSPIQTQAPRTRPL